MISDMGLYSTLKIINKNYKTIKTITFSILRNVGKKKLWGKPSTLT